MFSELIFFILGCIFGGIVVILRAAAREAFYIEKIEALEHRNRELEKNQMPEETPEAAYEQDKEPE